MSEEQSKRLRNGILIALIGALFGSILTIFGQPYINRLFEEAKIPNLLKESGQANIKGLPKDIQGQIAFITTDYSLSHIDGGTAEQITITISSSDSISLESISIDPISESNSVNQINERIIKIEIPEIRPSGKISFEITHSPESQILINEILKSGEISETEFKSYDSGLKWWGYLLIGAGIMLIIGIMWLIYSTLSTGAKYLVSLESPETENSEVAKSKIASIIIIVLAFNFLSMFDLGIVDIPRIPISDFFYALMIYLLFTNFKAIKATFKKAEE